jgi:hypothetical protein
MPLTNAPDDSAYVADPELTDVQYLRHLAELLPDITTTDPTLDCRRLRQIAYRLLELEPAPNDCRGEGHEVNRRLAPMPLEDTVEGFVFKVPKKTPGNPLTDHLSQDELDSVEDAMTGTLILTPEMSLPPNFPTQDPVALFNAHNDRDLVAEVRQEIKNAHANGFNPLQDGDMEIAQDIQNHTDAYDNVHIDTLAEAVARVRADPSDGMYNA